MGTVPVQSKSLGHPDGEARHHPYESRAIVAANEKKEDNKSLHENYVGDIKKIGLC
jgi:hypothetical protein